MLSTNVARIALALYRRAAAEAAEYDAEVTAWYTNGDGARRGLTFPYCRHGVSRWSDYDCACGACEFEGSGFDREATRRAALDEAKFIVAKTDKRRAAIADVLTMRDLPPALATELVLWSWQPVQEVTPRR